MTSFVLVHGGAHGAWCWEPLLAHLDGAALAVDLPPKSVRGVPAHAVTPPPELPDGRPRRLRVERRSPTSTRPGSIASCSSATRWAGSRSPRSRGASPSASQHLVFVSCLVPPDGGSIDRRASRGAPRRRRGSAVAAATAGEPGAVIGQFDEEHDASHVLQRHGRGAVGLRARTHGTRGAARASPIPSHASASLRRCRRPTCVSRAIRRSRPRIRTVRSRALRASPGGDLRVVELDTGHDVMISAPEQLATVLNGLSTETPSVAEPVPRP